MTVLSPILSSPSVRNETKRHNACYKTPFCHFWWLYLSPWSFL